MIIVNLNNSEKLIQRPIKRKQSLTCVLTLSEK